MELEHSHKCVPVFNVHGKLHTHVPELHERVMLVSQLIAGDAAAFTLSMRLIHPSRRVIRPSKRVNGRVNRVNHPWKGEWGFARYTLASQLKYKSYDFIILPTLMSPRPYEEILCPLNEKKHNIDYLT
jgi:hypothetical protein